MSTERLYTRDEVGTILESVLMNFDNGIVASAVPKEEQMAKRIKRPVVVNGEKHWLTGTTEQEVMDAYVRLCTQSGAIHNDTPTAPLLGDYIDEYFATFKNDQQSLTKVNRNRIIKNHIKPRFGDWQISKITVSDLQQWFNELGNIYAHETLLKIKNTLSPVLDSAVEDEYITRNPLKSSRIKLGGRETVHHKAIPHEQLDDIHKRIDELDDRERKMAVLLCTTGMRFEEILGVCWEDIDSINGWITVRRAVVHPERNLPEVKAPKTRSSARRIPISKYWL